MLSSWALSRIRNEIEVFRDKKRKKAEFLNDSSVNTMTPNYALAKKLGVPSGEEMYICADTSLSGNGGCGFIITNRGIYGKKWLGISKHFFSFERLARASEIINSMGDIEADGELVAACDNSYRSILSELIDNIIKITRQDLGM